MVERADTGSPVTERVSAAIVKTFSEAETNPVSKNRNRVRRSACVALKLLLFLLHAFVSIHTCTCAYQRILSARRYFFLA